MVLVGARHAFAQAPSTSPQVQPLPPQPASAPPALDSVGALPAAPDPSAVSEAEAASVTPLPVAAAPAPHFYERWWFWTAIGAAAITTVVILAVASGPGAPRTDLGNMPAF